MIFLRRSEIYQAIDAERDRQDAKWGYPRNELSPTDWITILTEEVGESADEALSVRFGGTHLDNFIKELIHTAAVAVSIMEHFGRGGTQDIALDQPEAGEEQR